MCIHYFFLTLSQIIGLDAECVKSDAAQIKFTLRRHLDRINEIEIFRASTKIFIPENNYGNEGSNMWHMVMKRPDIRCYWQKNDKPGVCKTEKTADEFQYTINGKMMNDSARFSSEFFTTSSKHTVQSIKSHFKQQLETYRYDFKEGKNGAESKQKITGKGLNANDDLVIAYGFNMIIGPVVHRDLSRLRK